MEKNTFYLVREEILPEAIKKTIKVKEILKRGEARTINEAVEKMGLSRSAYYKYRITSFRFMKPAKKKLLRCQSCLIIKQVFYPASLIRLPAMAAAY